MRKVLYLLGQLTDADVEWLLANGQRQHVARGAVLIRERQPLAALYIVLQGTLHVTFAAVPGHQPIGMTCGEMVGEMSFIDARLPSATVAAADEAVVLAIPHERLAHKLEADTAFAARFYKAVAVFLSSRLRAAIRTPDGIRRPQDEDEDELDTPALHKIQMAAGRFDRVLKRLLAE